MYSNTFTNCENFGQTFSSDNYFNNFVRGTLHVKVGPMFSGKTTWLNNELTKWSDKGFKVCKIIPLCESRLDVANSSSSGSTHNSSPGCLTPKVTIIPIGISDLSTVNIDHFDVIGIDEAQFLKNLRPSLSFWIDTLKKQVRVAGLDGDSQKQLFGDIYTLLPIADKFSKLSATCSICIAECKKISSPYPIDISFFNAPFTKKISSDSSSQIDVGGSDKYYPVCRLH